MVEDEPHSVLPFHQYHHLDPPFLQYQGRTGRTVHTAHTVPAAALVTTSVERSSTLALQYPSCQNSTVLVHLEVVGSNHRLVFATIQFSREWLPTKRNVHLPARKDSFCFH